jgi:hypothetical protein
MWLSPFRALAWAIWLGFKILQGSGGAKENGNKNLCQGVSFRLPLTNLFVGNSMNNATLTTLPLLTLLVLILFCPAKTNADLVWTFTDDGNGNIRETISGTLDLSNGTNQGATSDGGGFDLIKTDQRDWVQVHRYTTPTSGRSWFQVLDGYSTNPDMEMVNTSEDTTPGWENTDHLLFQIFNESNIFRVADFVGTYANGPTAINENVVHNVPISSVNEGVWRYGNLDDNIQGNGVLFRIGTQSVPEPSGFILLGSVLFCTMLRRRRRILLQLATAHGIG